MLRPSALHHFEWHLQTRVSSCYVLKMWLWSSIHFINELLCKLIGRTGPRRCPETCLPGTKCHSELVALQLTSHRPAPCRCLLAHKIIRIAVSGWRFQVKPSFTLFAQVRIFSDLHKRVLISLTKPSDLRLKSLIAKGFLLTSLTTVWVLICAQRS